LVKPISIPLNMAHLFRLSTEPVPWTEAFGTSNVLPPQKLLAFRIVLCVIFVANTIAHMYTQRHEGILYVIFLTRWSLILEVIYFCMMVECTRLAQCQGETKEPWKVKFTVLLVSIVHPLALVVTIVYWAAVKPVHRLCIVSATATCTEVPSYLACFAHGIDCAFCLASLLSSRITFQFSWMGWLALFSIVYCIWTFIHFHMHVGNPDNCAGYAIDDCPIYEVIDWHPGKRQNTVLILAAILFVLTPFAAIICKVICWFRDRADESGQFNIVPTGGSPAAGQAHAKSLSEVSI